MHATNMNKVVASKVKKNQSKFSGKLLIFAIILIPVILILTLLLMNFSELKVQYSLIRSEDYIKKARKALEENRLIAARILLQNAFRHSPQRIDVFDLFTELLEKEGSQDLLGFLVQKYLNNPTSESTRKLLQAAINTNQQSLVLPIINDILERFPNDAMIHRLVGIVFLGLRQYSEAESQILKAISLEPNNLIYRTELATLHLAHHNPAISSKASEYLNNIRKNPDLYLVASKSLAAFTTIQNPSDGLEIYKEISEKHPEDWTSRIRAFQISCHINPALAKEMLPDTWSRASTTAEKSEILMTLLSSFGPETTLEWSNKLTESELALPHINMLRINALWQQERYLEALKLANDGQNQAATTTERAFLTLWAYRCQKALKQDTVSIRSLDAMRQIAALDQRAAILLSNQFFGLGQESYGLAFLEIAANGKDVNAAQIALNALFAHYKQKADTAGLIRVHESIMRLQPENPLVQNNLAALLVLTNTDIPRALKLAESAYFSLPSNPVIVSNYAHTIATIGRESDALRLLDTIQSDQTTDSMRLYRAHVLYLNGQKEEAAELVSNIDQKEFLKEEIEILNKILAAATVKN